jgi:hypothetical protein
MILWHDVISFFHDILGCQVETDPQR